MNVIMLRRWLPLFPLATAVFSFCSIGRAEDEAEPESPVKISHDESGHSILIVDKETQERIELATVKLQKQTFQPEVIAYGTLEADPGQTFTLRSPVAGYLRSANEKHWPSLGESIDAGETIAAIEPRLTPTESLDLLTRWMDARAEVDELEAEVDAARSSFENKKRLNEEGKVVSDRSMEEAEAKLKSSEARLAGVKQRVDALENMMPNQEKGLQIPLTIENGGEIVELTAQPGEAVESGQALLRVTHFNTLIARVAALPGTEVPNTLSQARLSFAGHPDAVVPADPIGRAPMADPTTRSDTLLFRASALEDIPLRPGTPVIAHIPTDGAPITGTVVPRSAVLRYGGLAWVYVAVSETQFARRSIDLVSPIESGWFVTSGVEAGEAVVTAGAQSLLSEELKAEIESEEVAEE